jgi:alginate O-acetyltransferase complex protein AlgI
VLFPTITFAVFFTVVMAGHWLLMRRNVGWRVFMLAASYVFYGWWDYRFLLLLVASTVLDFVVARALARSEEDGRRRLLLTVSIVGNLALLGFFKYYDFFLTQLVNGAASFGVDLPVRPLNVILPVGISFFVFKTLSYTIDVYRRELEPTNSLLEYALFVGFWPELVAGPIVRGSVFLPQLHSEDRRPIEPARAYGLILGGLFKKMVIADLVATQLVDPVFRNPEGHSALETLVGVYGYAVQIFCDFSGYSDIATGCALLLGFRFPRNFDRPYAATSLQDFWRRWHITLSTWLRDYLYIGLGGNRGGRVRTSVNLLLTMLLGGLWHGAGWTFLVWGALHGGGLAVERAWRERQAARGRAPRTGPLWTVARTVATFHFVCLGWVFFRATDVERAVDMLGRIASGAWGEAGTITTGALIALVAGMAIQYVPRTVLPRLTQAYASFPAVLQGATAALAIMAIDTMGAQGEIGRASCRERV